jgi:hypothetical protein
MARPTCPSCGEVDTVRKASAVNASGTHTTSYEIPVVYGSGEDQYTRIEQRTATSQTPTAARLEPPPKPRGGISLIGFGVGWALPSSFIGFIVTNRIYKDVYSRIPAEKYWLPILAVLVIGIVVAAIWNQEQAKAAAKALPIWQYAIRRWNTLFYCMRCDGVFIPGNNSFATANQIQMYLYHGYADFSILSGNCQGDSQVSWQPPVLTQYVTLLEQLDHRDSQVSRQPPVLTTPAPLDVRATPTITEEPIHFESDDDYYDWMAERHGYED